MRRREVLFLCGEPYPVRYGFIEHVFGELFARHAIDVTWVMPTRDPSRVGRSSWHGRPLHLVPDRRGPKGQRASLASYRAYVLDAVARAEQDRSFDAVMVRNDLVMAFAGLRTARRLGVPFVVQLSHLIEETRIEFARRGLYGNPVKNRLAGTSARFLRNRVLGRADLLFPISEAMAAVLASYGLDPRRMVALPEGVDASRDPAALDADARRIRDELGLRDRSLMVYVGNMSRFRELDFLFDVLASARRDLPKLHLMMVGAEPDDPDVRWLRAEAERRGVLERVTFVGRVPRDEVRAYIRAADVGLSPFPPNAILSTNSPIKILEYLAEEVPAIATAIPEQERVLRDSGGGYAVEHTVPAFHHALETHFRRRPEEARAMGVAGRAWLADHRDYRVLALEATAALRALWNDDRVEEVPTHA